MAQAGHTVADKVVSLFHASFISGFSLVFTIFFIISLDPLYLYLEEHIYFIKIIDFWFIGLLIKNHRSYPLFPIDDRQVLSISPHFK